MDKSPTMTKSSVLVTGTHRSGTTWTGKMIALSDEIRYIDEAFTPTRNYWQSPIDTWFLDADSLSQKEQQRIEVFLNKIAYNRAYNFVNDIIYTKRHNVVEAAKNTRKHLQNFWQVGNRPLYKDPIGLMSAQWVAERLNAKVIVKLRHPAAFIASTLALGWGFDAKDLLRQSALVDNYLSPFKEELYRNVNEETSLFEQNLLAFKVLNHRIVQYYKEHSDWYFVRHEDLVAFPLEEFEKIYNYLEIPFETEVRKRLEDGVSKQVSKSPVTEKSTTNTKSWKSHLDSDIIDRIKEETAPYWQPFYSEDDW